LTDTLKAPVTSKSRAVKVWVADQHDAVIRVYDAAGDVVVTHEHNAISRAVKQIQVLVVGTAHVSTSGINLT